MLLSIAIVSQSINGLNEGVNYKKSHLKEAYYLRTFDIQPDNNLELLCIDAQEVRESAPFLKKYNLTTFSMKMQNSTMISGGSLLQTS